MRKRLSSFFEKFKKNELIKLPELEHLSEEILREVVREGETKVHSQFTSLLSATQRSLIIAGFAFGASSTSFGVYLSVRNQEPSAKLAEVALAFAIGMIVSSLLALIASWPTRSSQPGNEPKNWLPEHWRLKPREKRTMRVALREQAEALQQQIQENRRTATLRARIQIIGYLLIIATLAWCGWVASS